MSASDAIDALLKVKPYPTTSILILSGVVFCVPAAKVEVYRDVLKETLPNFHRLPENRDYAVDNRITRADLLAHKRLDKRYLWVLDSQVVRGEVEAELKGRDIPVVGVLDYSRDKSGELVLNLRIDGARQHTQEVTLTNGKIKVDHNGFATAAVLPI